ncbi:unnamed protein product [Acanthoscelides obtectus]|uniref:Uncharacterized protein n=1 Tax=Acanthoscelides obtectus TaxID=200917 RepID=A0A9P0KN24_ACAOB|nr:unnamed protein product [Acanthoscelides obtectus]CAK1669398.1 hypothetical protein AOBTE_LOCUS26987 [Acanthoscelides obtectus]
MVVYVGNIVSLLCIYMYHLSIMTTPNIYTIRDFFVLLLTLYGFVICYCWPAQNFADENEKIRDSVYSSNWYEYLRFSKPILMIMKRLELKVSISAGGIANINLETCLKVRSNNFMLIYFTDVHKTHCEGVLTFLRCHIHARDSYISVVFEDESSSWRTGNDKVVVYMVFRNERVKIQVVIL